MVGKMIRTICLTESPRRTHAIEPSNFVRRVHKSPKRLLVSPNIYLVDFWDNAVSANPFYCIETCRELEEELQKDLSLFFTSSSGLQK